MKRFKNILAVYNESIGADGVLSQAAALAKENGARLTLADIADASHLPSAVVHERSRRLARIAAALQTEGLGKVDSHVLLGTPHLEITRQVLAAGHDLVIASSEGGTFLRTVFYGDTATELMRKCPCPVWILKPDQALPYRRILAAVDLDMDNASNAELNVKIMDLAFSLAASHRSQLHIVHAWEVVGKDIDTLMSEIRDNTREELLAKHRAVHSAALEKLLSRYTFGNVDHEVHLMRGLPERKIVEVVGSRDIDLIVMGTASRTGISGFLMGNAAEAVLEAVRCSVMTVKPKGFVCPVARPAELAIA
jgi:nucleotide-binding universal stress UspA family protein